MGTTHSRQPDRLQGDEAPSRIIAGVGPRPQQTDICAKCGSILSQEISTNGLYCATCLMSPPVQPAT